MQCNEEIKLVIKAQQGDKTAFAELVRRYRTIAYAAAYTHLHDHNEAEDVTQDALLTAYEGIGSLKQPCKFGAWLCAIAVRKAMRRWTQKTALEDSGLVDEGQKIASEYDVWQALDAGELSKAIKGLVAELSLLHREAIELYYFQGYTISEVSKFLDVPVGTVKRRLHDARERLKSIISENNDQELFEELKRSLK